HWAWHSPPTPTMRPRAAIWAGYSSCWHASPSSRPLPKVQAARAQQRGPPNPYCKNSATMTLSLLSFLAARNHARSCGLALFTALALCVGSWAQAASPTTNQGKTTMQNSPRVQLQTNMGTVVIQLDAEKAPRTVENFLTYTKEGFFDGTIF